MPIHVNDIETLHDFAMGIMARAGHRTSQVRGIALAMLGGIIWRVDPGSIEIRLHDGGGANLLRWVSVTGYEYTCAYNQQTDEIEIHARNGRGSVLHSSAFSKPSDRVSSRRLRHYSVAKFRCLCRRAAQLQVDPCQRARSSIYDLLAPGQR